MSHVRGVADLGIFPVLGQPNLNIKVDRQKAARYGLNSGDVNSVVQGAMGGAVATSVLEGERQFDLVVRYTPEYREKIGEIRNIKVGYTTASGANAYIPLSELATISLDTGAAWILSRKRAAVHPREVQRPRTRSRQHGRGSPTAHRQECETSSGVSSRSGPANLETFKRPRNVWRSSCRSASS